MESKLAHSIRAGLSKQEFYEAEIWEVNAILEIYFSQKEQEFKNDWERARLIAGSMVGGDKIKFPWDNETKAANIPTKEEWDRAQAAFAQWDEDMKNRK